MCCCFVGLGIGVDDVAVADDNDEKNSEVWQYVLYQIKLKKNE